MNPVKKLAVRLVDRWIDRMPSRDRNWTLSRIVRWASSKLTSKPDAEEFRLLGSRLGVRSYSVGGTLGVFEGALQDDAIQAGYLKTGSWEPGLQRLLMDHVFREGKGTLVDVGANIGLVAIPVARKRGIRCLCFEPEPRNFGFLRNNIANNGVEALVEAFNIALFSTDDESLTFELSEENLGDHRVRVDAHRPPGHEVYAESRRSVITVKGARMDSVIDAGALQRPLVVKLDTQGSEARIVRGGRKTLEQTECLLSEFAPYWLRRLGDSPEAYLEELVGLGFGFGTIRDSAADGTVPSLKPIASFVEDVKAFLKTCQSDEFIDVVVARRPSYGAT
jgi:FkbM family methyltransferase